MKGELYAVYRRLETEHEATDWAFRVHDGALQIRHGPMDGEAGSMTIPARLCHERTPWREARLHTAARLHDGYVKIGVGRYPDDHLELAVREQSSTLALHWRPEQQVDRERFSGVLRQVMDRLRSAGVIATHAPRDGNGEPSLGVRTPSGEWRLSRFNTGLFGEHSRRMTARVYENDGTVPILVPMKIAHEFPGAVGFTWREPETPQVVAPAITETDYWLGSHVAPIEDTRRVAHALGLGPACMWVTQGATDSAPMWF